MRPASEISGCIEKYKNSGRTTPKTSNNNGPNRVHGMERRIQRIGRAGALGSPQRRNKSRRVSPLPIKVRAITTAPLKARTRPINKRPPQSRCCVQAVRSSLHSNVGIMMDRPRRNAVSARMNPDRPLHCSEVAQTIVRISSKPICANGTQTGGSTANCRKIISGSVLARSIAHQATQRSREFLSRCPTLST